MANFARPSLGASQKAAFGAPLLAALTLSGLLLVPASGCSTGDQNPSPSAVTSGRAGTLSNESAPISGSAPSDPQGASESAGGVIKTTLPNQQPMGTTPPTDLPPAMAELPFASLAELVPNATAEKVADSFRFTEGPLWHPDGYLLFSDIDANRIYKWMPGKPAEVFRDPSQKSNGLTFDRQGNLIACEHLSRSVTRTQGGAAPTPLVGRYEGKRLHSPNDCIFDKQGNLYFTDPPYGRVGDAELAYNGVFRFSAAGALTLISDKFERPNGLALTPKEDRLYVADTQRGHVRVFDIEATTGALVDKGVFAEVKNPDGMKVDERGHLYVTSADGVVVVRPDGKRLGTITVAEQPANCAFGERDRKTLYITARTGLYRVRLNAVGRAVHPNQG